MTRPSLLLSDIDGTLVNAAGELPPENAAALAAAKARGMTIGLATGRRWTTCLRLLRRLDLTQAVDWVILNNGMVVRRPDAGPALLMKAFPFEAVQAALARLEAIGVEPIILGHSDDGERPDVFWRRPCLWNGDFVAKNPDHAQRLGTWDSLRDHPLAELVLIGEEAPLARVQAALAGLPLETALIRNTFYQGFMLEITPEGASKATGAAALAEHLGLGAADTLAIGDSANDLPLLRWAGTSVAMAHAPEEVVAAVDFVASPGDGGVAEALHRFAF